ncbi:MAG TPA: hypothetical protein ENN43_04750 [bacterium]|nr:hypothetical protein [bacterium]
MNCPHCGAETSWAKEECQLCGKVIDLAAAFKDYTKKGDACLAAGDYDRAIAGYTRALDYADADEALYLKLADAFGKKGDKKAAEYLMKALSLNFYNEETHNALISVYGRFKRLKELKKWYEAAKARFDPGFADRYIKVIDSLETFKMEYLAVEEKGRENFARVFVGSMKRYMVMNIVLGLMFLLVAGAVAAAFFTGANTMFVVSAGVFFFFISIIAVTAYKARAGRKKREAAAKGAESIMLEFVKPAKDKKEPEQEEKTEKL